MEAEFRTAMTDGCLCATWKSSLETFYSMPSNHSASSRMNRFPTGASALPSPSISSASVTRLDAFNRPSALGQTCEHFTGMP